MGHVQNGKIFQTPTFDHQAPTLVSIILTDFPTSLLPALFQSVQCMSLSVTSAQTAAWRKQIFEQLSERSKREMDDFRHYEQAIEQVNAVTQNHEMPTILGI